jgi:tripeptide aminopeptidase
VLPDDPTQVLTIENSPHLSGAIGQDVITASGKTLLGADDKAGVAVVMAAARHLLQHPEIRHGKIRLCFNPDEEIGRGVDKLDLARVGAVAAYTLDGESPGEIDWETFSADGAVVEIRGVASHPGWAKGVMVNALRLAGRFVASLPMECSPERTADRDGFVHPVEISGNSERATVRLILRDFELDGLAAKRAVVERAAAAIRAEEPRAQIEVKFAEQYRNMRYWLEKDMRAVEVAQAAVRACGLEPRLRSVRGGTDGSKLTARGLLTPNIFTGMHEVHSQREWVTLQDMAQSAEVLLKIAQLWAK